MGTLGRHILAATCAVAFILSAPCVCPGDLEWPPATRETRPWTRWWWMGSAVDPAGLTIALEAYRAAGLGGVEITPIYGVHGFESRFKAYLSPEWMALLEHALREARRLDLGVDMALATGWPFGGPWVSDEAASRCLAHRTWSLPGGQRLGEAVRFRQEPLVRAVGHAVRIEELRDPVESNAFLQRLALDQVRFPKDAPLVALVATSSGGERLDLTSRVAPDRMLDWVAPPGDWRLDAVFLGWHGKMVERAAPGGEGRAIDHFSKDALRSHLGRFERAFAGRDLGGLRAFFNDSYEVDDAAGQADATPALFDEFRKRRGYDLLDNLPALFGEAEGETGARVLADYRETISDLLLERFTEPWRAWARGRGAIVRNQAHGSPASILDLYAASDIPETEGRDPLRMRWASSAAHVAGRRLVSAEAATWLGEHFRSSLAEVREAADDFYLAGINHVVYHGTSYAPPGEPWPGWPFYASVHFDPYNPWWRDFSALNRHVTRAQSFLQKGEPGNDVLLYHPLYDSLAVRGTGLLTHFGGERPGPDGSGFDAAARQMLERGYTFDFISDRQLSAVRVAGGALRTAGGSRYRTILLPPCRFIPLETFEVLTALAREGATVAVLGRWPEDVAGLGDLEARRARYRSLLGALRFEGASGVVSEARIGSGTLLRFEDLEILLARAGVRREAMVDRGVQFSRRRLGGGWCYFVAHRGEQPFDGWLPLSKRAASVALFDPMDGRHGLVRTRVRTDGETEVHLQLARGESLLLVTSDTPATGETLAEYQPAGPPSALTGTWNVAFVAGGPERPADVTTDRLGSWTRLPGEAPKAFSGTASYTILFPRPEPRADAWLLDLGRVADSARVRLNGRDLGVLIGPRFRITVLDALRREGNRLEVSVTNIAANRIADLDRRQVEWKKFYNVNFPARLGENRGPDGLFTAARWEPLDSGLLGPVTLTPLRVVGR